MTGKPSRSELVIMASVLDLAGDACQLLAVARKPKQDQGGLPFVVSLLFGIFMASHRATSVPKEPLRENVRRASNALDAFSVELVAAVSLGGVLADIGDTATASKGWGNSLWVQEIDGWEAEALVNQAVRPIREMRTRLVLGRDLS